MKSTDVPNGFMVMHENRPVLFNFEDGISETTNGMYLENVSEDITGEMTESSIALVHHVIGDKQTLVRFLNRSTIMLGDEECSFKDIVEKGLLECAIEKTIEAYNEAYKKAHEE